MKINGSVLSRLLAPLVGLLALCWPRDRKAVALLFTPNQGMEGNMAAVAHEILANGQEFKLFLLDHRGNNIEESARKWGATYIAGGSFAEFVLRLRCRRYIISHSHKPLRGLYALIGGTVVINVWHGIPIKGMGNLDAHFRRRKLRTLFRRNRRLSAFTVSSELERALIAGCFFIDASRIAMTGMPRLDWLLKPTDDLPPYLAEDEVRLDALLRGRRLVLYAPTFRDYDRKAIGFTEAAFRELGKLLEQHGAVLGVRPHPRDAALFDSLLTGVSFAVDLSSQAFPESTVLMRRADVLISDYSSIWIEFLLLNRPVIAWTWDREKYANRRGLMMELDSVFPGVVAETSEELFDAVKDALGRPHGFTSHDTNIARLFHRYQDGKNTSRVLELMRKLA